MVPAISLILPCYNEDPVFDTSVDLITGTLDSARYPYEIIFVDDASSDGTPRKIARRLKRRRNLRAVYHQTNRGRGRSVTEGMMLARGKVVGYIDIDCEVSPVYIPEMVRLILAGGADGVIGKRIYRTNLHSILREVLSVGYRKLADRTVGTGGLDTESGYKFFDRKKIVPVLKRTSHPHWFWDTEIVVFARRKGLRITELPVLFVRRFDKQSSVRIVRDTADYIINLWRLRARLAGEGRI